MLPRRRQSRSGPPLPRWARAPWGTPGGAILCVSDQIALDQAQCFRAGDQTELDLAVGLSLEVREVPCGGEGERLASQDSSSCLPLLPVAHAALVANFSRTPRSSSCSSITPRMPLLCAATTATSLMREKRVEMGSPVPAGSANRASMSRPRNHQSEGLNPSAITPLPS